LTITPLYKYTYLLTYIHSSGPGDAFSAILFQMAVVCDLKSNIAENSNRPQIETILDRVLTFQFDHVCFQREEASVNVSVETTYLQSHTQI